MTVRYLIKFTKESEIKFISHLDMLRTIEKIISKSELDVTYSQGYHPRIISSIAQPLSVGVYSSGDYLDLEMNTEVAEEEMIKKLNEASPLTMRFINATKLPETFNNKKVPQAMALIDGAKYEIKIKYDDTSKLIDEMKALQEMNEWVTIKKTKKGEKEADIKPFVKQLEYSIEGNVLRGVTIISCGSRENLSADLLAKYIKSKTSSAIEDSFIEIKRTEMYAYDGEKLVALDKYFR